MRYNKAVKFLMPPVTHHCMRKVCKVGSWAQSCKMPSCCWSCNGAYGTRLRCMQGHSERVQDLFIDSYIRRYLTRCKALRTGCSSNGPMSKMNTIKNTSVPVATSNKSSFKFFFEKLESAIYNVLFMGFFICVKIKKRRLN